MKKYLVSFLLLIISIDMNAKYGNFFFNKNVFLSCTFADGDGVYKSFHHLWNDGELYSWKTSEDSDDLEHSFAIFTISETRTLTHKVVCCSSDGLCCMIFKLCCHFFSLFI